MNQESQAEDEPRSDDAGPHSADEGHAGADAAAADKPETDAERVARLEDQLRRSMADLANFQRRKLKEVQDARQRAVEGLAAELLPVVDNFHLALGATEQGGSQEGFDVQSIIDGMAMVRSMLEGVLERHGLSEIQAAGNRFDPNLHDAVGIDAESETEPGTVTQVVQRGYRLADKVLRPSRVMVSGDAPAGDGSPD